MGRSGSSSDRDGCTVETTGLPTIGCTEVNGARTGGLAGIATAGTGAAVTSILFVGAPDFFATAFLTAGFFADAFRAAGLLTADRRAAVLRAVGIRAVVLRAAGLRLVVLRAVVFRAAVLRTVVLPAAVLRAVV